MGVTGLWRLIEPTGKPVPVETLENKVLAVDISIWLHQVVKGYQDAKGAPLPNAHLMGLFQRLCKLLYFRIKPVFVFDGGFPDLKRETIAKRQDNKSKYNSESERLKRELAIILSKKTAVNSILGINISPKKAHKHDSEANNDDIFKLPALPQKDVESESESDEESSGSTVDLHSVDLESDNFKNMAVKEKYDLLLELKETRKMNSWGKLHELPKKSDNFSDFQMQRLLKRRKVQECLQGVEKEMGETGMSLNDLESLLNDEGIDTKIDSLPSRRIASNDTTRFILIKDVKKALAEAKERQNKDKVVTISEKPEVKPGTSETETPKKDELEDDLEKAIKMSLECMDEPSTSNTPSKTDDSWSTLLSDSDYSYIESDSNEDDGFEPPDMSNAKAYIMQYSDFTDKAIEKMVVKKNKPQKQKSKRPNVNEIIQELENEKSVIADQVDLSSGDEDESYKKNDKDEVIIKTEGISDLSEGESNTEFVNLDKINSSSSMDDVQIVTNEESVINIDDTQNVSTNTNEEIKNDEEITETKSITPEKTVPSNTDSSDGEFEEVQDNIPKTVVELSLNLEDTLEDDIFADVFSDIKKDETALKNSKQEDSNKITIEIEESLNNDERKDGMPKQTKTKSNNIKIVNSETNNTLAKVKDTGQEIIRKFTTKATHTSSTTKTTDTNSTTTTTDNNSTTKTTDTNSTTKTTDTNSITKTANTISTIGNLEQNDNMIPKQLTSENLNEMVENLEKEERDILHEKGRLDRVGRNITEQMTKDAQELLQLFGIPYVVAPMEAEAQCAFLENVKLTDGTITDDSDIWLFGGKTVYKNFFNQKKHVLQFISERIEKSYNLTREQLILLALLVGSDYTTGVAGVGPVTALEILASFPYNKKQINNDVSKQDKQAVLVAGLNEFKKWMRSGKRTDNTTLKKKLRNVNVADEFPSVRVVQAYLEPNVEKSEDNFTWGQLDVSILREYTKAKFGWSQNKFDEIIKPVVKRIQDRQTQRSLQDYFKRKIEFHSLDDQMSKRVKAAVNKMRPDGSVEVSGTEKSSKKKINRKRKPDTKIEDVGQNITGDKTHNSKKPKEKDPIIPNVVKIDTIENIEKKSVVEINVKKMERFQEVIPQREKDKRCLLQNKMKAIEAFRKTTLDRKHKPKKKRAAVPKEKANLSESSESD